MNLFFPITAVFIWAANAVVSKLATGAIEPGAIAFYRWLFALFILLPFCVKPVWQQRQLIVKHLGKLAILASLGMVLNQCLAYYAAHTTSATNIAVFLSLMPLFSLFLAVPLLGKQLKQQALIGAVISFSGLLYMLSEGSPVSLLTKGIQQGDSLMFISSLAYALYSILLNKWKLPLKPWTSVFCQITIATLLQLPLLLSSNSYAITTTAFPMVLFAAAFASVLAPWFWLKGVQRIGAAQATLFMNLVPIFTVLISLLFLGQSPTVYHLIGGGFVFIGLLLAQVKIVPCRVNFNPDVIK
ncbi:MULTISPECIES: DMT family transporter [Aliivibrio]|jgi:drug/metabolite transporter (DMT)-like permease|uniref:Integral membrane protein n=1 Tax=Aliivibrio salmonicida (strain LFI1238) TaxID=316275 RepID=B6ELX7_ALISL|nr:MULTISPECIES: DMT family transporter [Aliivibrio]OCH18834.1 multidrug DMT transporter [Aliivibrio sp. 1S165]OCH19699.1 multidrug DMT transporter [Aliivibrio sp. 1S128]OCH30972.1 multidrug DMT transporter [Aliivibrio sp. 1S175]CAQ79297.1 integral membrane protein [Aliivibrio salmonicida LFI1238]